MPGGKRRRPALRVKEAAGHGAAAEDDTDAGEPSALTAVAQLHAQRRRAFATGHGVTAEALAAPPEKQEGDAEKPAEAPADVMGGFASEAQVVVDGGDDDPRLQRYIAEQLAQRRGGGAESARAADAPPRVPQTDAELLRAELMRGGHGKQTYLKEKEGTTLEGGLEEVELTLEARVANLEATEEAVRKRQRTGGGGGGGASDARVAAEFRRRERR